jgi:NADPH:quinone reductase-like Zn-dependent oxidoreductase
VVTNASPANALMKAVVQERYGSPDGLYLRDIPVPPVEDDSVLVRVRAASLNASDWHLMHRLPHLIGRMLLGRRPSRVRGGDLAGSVEAVGKTVTRWKPGDEVFGVGRGSFAEFAIAPEDRLAPKPRGLTFEQAAALGGAGCTALQGLRDHAHLRPGQRVLVYGAGGGVGTFAVQIAKALGAHVTAVTATANLDLLRSIGADEVVDYTKEDFTGRGQRYDVVFDIGADRREADYRRVLEQNGTLVLVGAPSGFGAMLLALVRVLSAGRRKNGRVSFIARIKQEDLVALKELVDAGRLMPVIDRQYPLKAVPDALRHLGTRSARGKVVITVT